MKRFLIAALAFALAPSLAHAAYQPTTAKGKIAAAVRAKSPGLRIDGRSVTVYALQGPGRVFNAHASRKAPFGIAPTMYTVSGSGKQIAGGFKITSLKITKNKIQPKAMPARGF